MVKREPEINVKLFQICCVKLVLIKGEDLANVRAGVFFKVLMKNAGKSNTEDGNRQTKMKSDGEDKSSHKDGQLCSESRVICPTVLPKQCSRFYSQPMSQCLNNTVQTRSQLGSVLESPRKRKLLIHLDIRNTILVADSVTNVSVEEALNSFLTGVVWGSVVAGSWTWYSSEPSLKCPAPGLCTYYKYLEKQLVKNPTDRVTLRLQTGDFVHTALGQRFQAHFEANLRRLSWPYQEDAGHHRVLTMAGRDGKPYHYILPSFYKLLHHLQHQKRDFAVIIRTYGRDGPNVLRSLKYGLKGKHPAFPNPADVEISETPGHLTRGHNEFELVTYVEGVKKTLTDQEDIYRQLCSARGISGLVDDFAFWQGQNYDHGAGKPMWIDPTDLRHHHIFFDDNFRADDEDSIVDVRVLGQDKPRSSLSLDHSELPKLEDVFLVQADLLESINDEQYFIRKIDTCEENFSKMIKNLYNQYS